jgi:hypothetical protein
MQLLAFVASVDLCASFKFVAVDFCATSQVKYNYVARSFCGIVLRAS